MAIIENRSTEQGDVIRIQTNIPIIGVVSLNAFTDNVIGESLGTALPSIIPAFDKGTRIDNRHILPVQKGIQRYGIIRSIDGSNKYVGIGSLNVVTAEWDLNYPENKYTGAVNTIIINDNLYVQHRHLISNNNIRIVITRINLSTRIWTTLNNGAFLGASFVPIKGSRINRLYLLRHPRAIAGAGPNAIIDPYYDLIEYNIASNTFNEISTFPLISLVGNFDKNIIETLIYIQSGVIDETNNKLYISYNGIGGYYYKQFYIYDFSTNTWSQSSTSTKTWTTIDIFWNEEDNLIYTKEFIGDRNTITYNTITDTWNENLDSPPLLIWSYTGGNNKIYASYNSRDVISYNPNSDTWGGQLGNDKFFIKKFRYSTDGGLNFSEFIELSEINIANIIINEKDAFVVDISYERAGLDPTGELQWNSTTLFGQYAEQYTPIYDTTIFKKEFEALNTNVLNWALNVLEKIYRNGLLPEYITRNNGEKDDTDFITYWFSITHLFAILVYWMRLFENMLSNRNFITDFLKSFDLTLPFDLNLEVLGKIFTQRLKEYRKRGTEQIKKPTTNVDIDIDGELLRLLNWNESDFFLFALTRAKRFGWCIGICSPMWTSTAGITNLIMGYEFTIGVNDLAAYPLENPSYISIVEDSSINENVMQISGYTSATGSVGIFTNLGQEERQNVFPIFPDLDYELSFKVKKITSDPLELKVLAGAYDINLNNVPLEPIDGDTNFTNSFQSSPGEPTVLFPNIYYRYNVVLHGTNTIDTTNFSGNIRTYRGLRMPSNARYIGFSINVTGGIPNRSDFYMYDIKIRPKDLPISQGLFGVKNIIIGYLKNNGELDNELARLFIQNKLIPYNSFLIPEWL